MKKPAPTNQRVLILITALAIIFWLMIKLSNQFDHTLDIPLQITMNNADYILKYPAPDKIRVKFSGRGVDLMRLNFYSPMYEIDLSDVREKSTRNLAAHKEYVRFPKDLNVDVKSIVTPHEITFEVDQRRERKVKLAVASKVKTSPGFTLVDIRSIPDSITVIGPASYVDTLNMLPVIEKEFTDRDRAFIDLHEIQRHSRFFSEYDPTQVNIDFDIQRLAEKVLENVPVEVVNVGQDYEVVPLPAKVDITVKGGEKILAEAVQEDFRAIINFSRDWSPGVKHVKAEIETDLPILNATPQHQKFEIIVQKRRTRAE
ncbi:MAG: hypothetical protein AAFP70_08860, partial [Calditrichota bacterium]